jgi:hypothetical protein
VLRVTQQSPAGETTLAEMTLLGQDSIALQLRNGTYTVTSAQRPCDGTCTHLDAERDACTATVRVDDDTRRVVTTVRAGRGCSIAARS